MIFEVWQTVLEFQIYRENQRMEKNQQVIKAELYKKKSQKKKVSKMFTFQTFCFEEVKTPIII